MNRGLGCEGLFKSHDRWFFFIGSCGMGGESLGGENHAHTISEVYCVSTISFPLRRILHFQNRLSTLTQQIFLIEHLVVGVTVGHIGQYTPSPNNCVTYTHLNKVYNGVCWIGLIGIMKTDMYVPCSKKRGTSQVYRNGFVGKTTCVLLRSTGAFLRLILARRDIED
jgi:hypothetical protein